MRVCGGLVFGTCPVVGAAALRPFVSHGRSRSVYMYELLVAVIVGRSCIVWYSCKRVIFYPLLLFLCTTVSLNSIPACACFFILFSLGGNLVFVIVSMFVSIVLGCLVHCLFCLCVCVFFLDTFAQCNFPLWAVVRICF